VKVGDVLPMKSIRVVHDTGWLNYKAPPGERFLVVLLGSEPTDGSRPLDPHAVFRELGWVEGTPDQASSRIGGEPK
jgi:hypothetical protein